MEDLYFDFQVYIVLSVSPSGRKRGRKKKGSYI